MIRSALGDRLTLEQLWAVSSSLCFCLADSIWLLLRLLQTASIALPRAPFRPPGEVRIAVGKSANVEVCLPKTQGCACMDLVWTRCEDFK